MTSITVISIAGPTRYYRANSSWKVFYAEYTPERGKGLPGAAMWG